MTSPPKQQAVPLLPSISAFGPLAIEMGPIDITYPLDYRHEGLHQRHMVGHMGMDSIQTSSCVRQNRFDGNPFEFVARFKIRDNTTDFVAYSIPTLRADYRLWRLLLPPL